MKKVTSVTIWNDSAGRRVSVTYSEINESTHRVVKDNVRENFILFADDEVSITDTVLNLTQNIIDTQ